VLRSELQGDFECPLLFTLLSCNTTIHLIEILGAYGSNGEKELNTTWKAQVSHYAKLLLLRLYNVLFRLGDSFSLLILYIVTVDEHRLRVFENRVLRRI
jgi:hypothetical protein